MGREPVARGDHFPGGFRIERFVGIGDGATPEAREKGQRREQEQRKRDAMHFCYTTGSFGRFCFRSLSRTLLRTLNQTLTTEKTYHFG